MAKDRSAHEAARGVKKLKLADLSKQRPSAEQLANYAALLMEESDRGAAVMAGALVENTLELAIRCSIAEPKGGGDGWFVGPLAPFGAFAPKITLGRALGIYGPGMEARLSLIKDIRNAFAHSSIPLDFNHEAIKAVIPKLLPRPGMVEKSTAKRPVKVAFGSACLALSQVLVNYAHRNGGKTIKVAFP